MFGFYSYEESFAKLLATVHCSAIFAYCTVFADDYAHTDLFDKVYGTGSSADC